MARSAKDKARQKPQKNENQALSNRAIGLAIALIVFVALLYIGTIAKLWP